MSFEVFEDTRARTKEYISVTENKTFGLPRTFIDKQKISSDHKAVILFDAEANKVALHFTLKSPKYALSVRIPNDNQGGMVVAKSFFELKGIDAKKYSGRYHDFEIVPLKELGFDKDDVAYVIQLTEKKESAPKKQTAAYLDDIVIDDVGDEPINLEDIPF